MKIFFVGKYLFKKQIKSSAYWNVFMWPLVLSIMASVTLEENATLSLENETGAAESLLLIMVIFIMAVSFIPIIVRELQSDRALRVEETLIAMSDEKIQFWGKIGGIYALMIFTIVLYALIVFFLGKYSLYSNYIEIIFGQINLKYIFSFFLEMFIGLSYVIAGSAMTGILLKDEDKVFQATLPLMIVIMLLSAFSFWIVTKSSMDGVTQVVMFLPIIGQEVSIWALKASSASLGWIVIGNILNVLLCYFVFQWLYNFYKKRLFKY